MQQKEATMNQTNDNATLSDAELAWQRANTFNINGTRIQTPFATMKPSTFKWYIIGSFIFWACVFYGCHKAWTTTIRPLVWGAVPEKAPLTIDVRLLDQDREATKDKVTVKYMHNESLVKRPVRKKHTGGFLDKIILFP